MHMQSVHTIVLAYSGGLDTSVIVHWLKTTFRCRVICFTAHLGQSDDLTDLEERARASGADALIVRDLREEFAREYLFRLLKAGAVYERRYLLGTAIARPLIAWHLVDVAHQVGADAVAHGATGKGNDQVRFELACMALDPDLRVIAPWRIWDLRSREDLLAYAREHQIPVRVREDELYSRDSNLWHISHEGGVLEDPACAPPDDVYMWTRDPATVSVPPEEITITFEQGIPVMLNGKSLSPATMVETLNAIGARHGIGRVDMVENRLVGMKSRGIYETPGGTILFRAHQELESLVLDHATLQMKDTLALRYAELVYQGLWFTPLREALDAFFDQTQRVVTGTVRLRLFRGNVFPVARTSPYSLYRQDLATFGDDRVYDHRDATGFIRLFGLPLKVRALQQRTASVRAPVEIGECAE